MNEENLNKSYYAVLPANVRYDVRLKDKAKLLYAEITGLVNEKGYCWATNNYFAKLYNISKGNISKLLSQLKEYGYIHIELIRNKETKQIEKRIITLLTKNTTPIVKNDITPMVESEGNIILLNKPIGIVKNDITPMVKNDSKEYYKYINNIKEYYNGRNCFPKIIKLTDQRKNKLVKRLKEVGYDNLIKAIDIASISKFLTGENDTNWKMDFDWLIKNETNITKVLEGKYSNIEETQNIYGPELK